MNDSQKAAYQQKVVKEESKPQENQKKIKCNLFEAPTKENPYVDYNFLDSLFKVITQNDYRSLYAQSSQGIMKTVFQNWKSFFASLKEYKETRQNTKQDREFLDIVVHLKKKCYLRTKIVS